MSSGKIITKHRNRLGLTQEELAERIRVSRQTIAMWETEKQFPTDNMAILAARFLKINEDELLKQLRWDRLHQRVEHLEKQYDAIITVTPRKEGKMEDLRKIASQTIQGVTLSVKRIYKSINFESDPERRPYIGGSDVHRPDVYHLDVYHPGEVLIMHLMLENQNDAINMTPHIKADYYIEDNLGNRFYGQGGCIFQDSDEAKRQRISTFFHYVPEAISITFRCDVINAHEDDCDVIFFENIPLDGKEISKTLNGHILTYNGVSDIIWDESRSNSHWLQLAHNHPLEARNVGVTKVADNLGNQYHPCGHGIRCKAKGECYEEQFQLRRIDSDETRLHPDAKSISFKYLFARTILTFELRDLPLPS